MRIIECEQGSPEWNAARLGIPTASQFSRIITPKTMKLSASADGYMNELLAEWLLGTALDDGGSGFTSRGSDMESEAVRFYEFQNDVVTQKVGFCLRDDAKVGCSPDRLVGNDGGLEIKCPSAKNHVGYLLGSAADDYYCQIQGNLWITGRQWWDVLSFNPYLPPAESRIDRDDEFIEKLAVAVDGFIGRMREAQKRLIEIGAAPRLLAA